MSELRPCVTSLASLRAVFPVTALLLVTLLAGVSGCEQQAAVEARQRAEQAKQETEQAKQEAVEARQRAVEARQRAEQAEQEAEQAKQEAEQARRELADAKQPGANVSDDVGQTPAKKTQPVVPVSLDDDGLVDDKDLLAAQVRLGDAEFGFLNAGLAYNQSHMNYKKAVGTLLQDERITFTRGYECNLPIQTPRKNTLFEPLRPAAESIPVTPHEARNTDRLNQAIR